MKEELNIAAILKDKPSAKLWSPIIGVCTYINYYPSTEEIVVSFTNRYGEEGEWNFHQSGRTLSASKEADSLLFPSKQMRSWEKFAWKKGDVLKSPNYLVIFDRWCNDDYTSFIASFELCQDAEWGKGDDFPTSYFSKVSDEEAKEFIKKLEEHCGGKLNLSTLEIEKQPKFKDGDILVAEKDAYYDKVIFIAKISDDVSSMALIAPEEEGYEVHYQDYKFFSNRTLRLATDSEKQQLFDALAKEGKAWDADKKVLVDLPKKCEFKAFDKVMVRDSKDEVWRPAFFWREHSNGSEYVILSGEIYNYCIPYNDQTKHLLGTTDEWKGGEG